MYLKQVELQNIKGFRDASMDLTRPDGSFAGWTVITGENGAGKSTLLKAIALGLVGVDTARALQPNLRGWVRAASESAESAVQLEVHRTPADDGVEGPGPPAATLTPKLRFEEGDRGSRLTATSDRALERMLWSINAKGWFSCAYGPFRRIFGASADAMRQMTGLSTSRFATLFEEAASLSEIVGWLRDLNTRAQAGDERSWAKLNLVLSLLRDGLLPNGITVDRIDADGLWLRDRSGAPLSWGEMSDGYRAALALLTDLLRHLINIYGPEGLAAPNAEGQLVIQRSGVVLIDEVDAHLHPEWQREIGFWLKRRFPFLQFIVTTHSPIICQAADPNGIFTLEATADGIEVSPVSDEAYHTILAARPDTILRTPVFGLQNTRSPVAVEARRISARLRVKERGGFALSPQERAALEAAEELVLSDEEGA
jgi:hypothetical protein